MENLLTVDIGNTTLGFGIFRGRRLQRTFRLPTPRTDSRRDLRAGLRRSLGSARGAWAGVVFASVVPRLDRVVRAETARFCRAPVLTVTPKTALPLGNAYRPPRAVGADRIVNALAAVTEFGAPVLVADFGTAITVDAVSRDRQYLGGAILPGLELAAEALYCGTALLPRARLTAPGPVLGRDTQASLRSGLLYGTADAVAGLVARMRRKLGPRTPVVATGGLAGRILPHCPVLKVVRPDLTHYGLRLAWEYTRAFARRRP